MYIFFLVFGLLKDIQFFCEFFEEDEGEDGVMIFFNFRYSFLVLEMLSKSYDYYFDVIRIKIKVLDMLGNLNGDNFVKEFVIDSLINSVQ